MAGRAPAIKHYNNFINGKVSDGNEFSAPENAAKDILNMELQKDGTLKKRSGLAFETTSTYIAGGATSPNSPYSGITDWHNTGPNGDQHYALFQNQGKLSPFIKGGADLYSNPTNTQSYTNDFPMSIAVARDFAVICPVKQNPERLEMSGADVLTTTEYFPRMRDFAGANDGYDIDYNPTVSTVTFSAAVSLGETVTGTTSGYKAKVLEAGTGALKVMFVGTHGFLPVEAFTGDMAGAGNITAVTANDGLSEAHYYNLKNQGWSDDNMFEYAKNGTWPSNAQIMYAGKDSSGDFSQVELDKINFGQSPAPKGHIIFDAYQQKRSFTYPINGGTAVVDTNTAFYFFKAVSVFAGRVAYLGASDPWLKGKVFITQLLDKNSSDLSSSLTGLRACHSVNDPTAEELNDTLPTDGLVLDIPEAGDLLWSETIGRSLIVFATNGIWAIQGSIDTGFTAQTFSVNNISSETLASELSVVKAGSSLLFWTETGIMTLREEQAGVFSVTSLSDNKISREYREQSLPIKASASGYYDKFNNRVYWAHGDAESWGTGTHDELKGYARNKIWVLDLDTLAFLPYDATLGADIGVDPSTVGSQSIAGFTQDPYATITGIPEVKVGLTKISTGGTFNADINWGNFAQTGFYDWAASGSPYAAYMEGWSEHLGAPHVDKQIDYCVSFFKRTETAFVDNGSGGVAFDKPSSAMLSARWEWTDLDVGQWTAAQQAYKFLRPYISGATGDPFNYGYTVIRSKLDVGGKGSAVAIRYDAEEGKDMHLLGYTVVFTANSTA